MPLSSRYFLELTQPEIAAQLARNPLVLLPAGSVEQHGPHLPAGTDILAANAVAQAVAERMDGLLLPGGPLGVTPMHMPYEATLTLTAETYIQVVTETCASAAQHGARYLLIINWHEGNIPSLALAAGALHRQHRMTVLTVQACYAAEEMFGAQCGGLTHGGEIEALAVMACRPELVHLDRVDGSGDDPTQARAMDKLRRTRAFQPALTDIRSIAPAGWYGHPQPATPEKGRSMVNAVADRIARESAQIFLQLDLVQGGVAELKPLSQVM